MRRLLRPRPLAAPADTALAPLVDVFTLLVVVLLRAWSTDPPSSLAVTELAPPLAVGTGEAPRLLQIDVGREGIYLDGLRVASTRWYAEHDEALVEELRAPLLQQQVDRVAIRPDASLPYRVIQKVLLAVREAGISEVVVVTVDRGSL